MNLLNIEVYHWRTSRQWHPTRKTMKRDSLLRWLLLTLPVWLLPLVIYIAEEGQVKSVGLFFLLNGLIVALLECVVLFLYRFAVVIHDKFRR